MVNIDEYAEWTNSLWRKQDPERMITHAAIGLAEEVGEVMGVLKRRVRDDYFDEAKFIKEMGDVAYYWSRLALEFGIQPSTILATNKAKLLDRKARGALRGSGDDR